MSTAPLRPEGYRPHPEFAEAERLFWRDLPQLLPTKFGRWVVYTSQGCIAEGDDEMALFDQCRAMGLQERHYLIARVEPDAPVAEATWLLEDLS